MSTPPQQDQVQHTYHRMNPDERLDMIRQDIRHWELVLKLLLGEIEQQHRNAHYYEFRAEVGESLAFINLQHAYVMAQASFLQFAKEARGEIKDLKEIEKCIKRDQIAEAVPDVIEGLRLLRDDLATPDGS